MYIHDSDQPIPEDVIFNELRRLQEMIMCANLSNEERYILSSIIDAGFIIFEQTKPGYHKPHTQFIRMCNAIN